MSTGALWILILAITAIGIAIYLIPGLVAMKRRHHQRMAILALNILAGWTVIGWIGALVWALTEVRRAAPAAARS